MDPRANHSGTMLASRAKARTSIRPSRAEYESVFLASPTQATRNFIGILANCSQRP